MSEAVQLKADDNVVQDEVSYPAKLVEVPGTANVTGLQGPSPETPGTNAATVATEQKGMTLKGMLMMVVCCGAPFLLLAALGLFGVSLSGAGSALTSVALVLACPVGMYLMMRIMMKNNNSK